MILLVNPLKGETISASDASVLVDVERRPEASPHVECLCEINGASKVIQCVGYIANGRYLFWLGLMPIVFRIEDDGAVDRGVVPT